MLIVGIVHNTFVSQYAYLVADSWAQEKGGKTRQVVWLPGHSGSKIRTEAARAQGEPDALETSTSVVLICTSIFYTRGVP